MSNGIPINPIIPKIKKAAMKFGTTPINDKAIFLNNIKINYVDIFWGVYYNFL